MYEYRVLGLDPGGSTGWAMASITTKGQQSELWTEGHLFWDAGEIDHPDHYLALDNLLSSKLRQPRHRVSLVLLCEGWDDRNNPAAETISLEYIGVVKRWVQMHPQVTASYPAPHTKEWTDDRKLKALDLYEPGHRHRHRNDARRHVIRHLCADRQYYPLLRQLREGLHG